MLFKQKSYDLVLTDYVMPGCSGLELIENVRNKDATVGVIMLTGSGAELDSQGRRRSEEHTSELQSRLHLVCRLLLEKKKIYSDIDPAVPRAPPPAAGTRHASLTHDDSAATASVSRLPPAQLAPPHTQRPGCSTGTPC